MARRRLGVIDLTDVPTFPPPRPVSGGADVVAIIMSSAGALSALLLLVALTDVVRGPRPHRGIEETHPVGSAVALALATALLGLTALGLRRRRAWAWWACVAEFAGGVGLLALSVVLVSHGHDHTDSSGMAAVSLVVFIAMVLTLLGVLVVPSTRRGFRSATADWYFDPGGRRVRWWDGAGWTDHVSD